MKPRLRQLILVAAGSTAMAASAANYSVLHHFTGSTNDGAYPYGELIISGGALYGTTEDGGSGNGGTVFRVDADGANFALLNPTNGFPSIAGVILSNDMLYGVTFITARVFKISTNGTGFAVLKSLGSEPSTGKLLLDGDTLYGTYNGDDFSNYGLVFKLKTDGTGYAVLHTFSRFSNDGNMPSSALVLSGTTLYGTTYYGGRDGAGTVFKVETSGTGFGLLHEFGPTSEGINPRAALLLSGSTLYGTTTTGSTTVFQIQTDGTGFSILHAFTGSEGYDAESPLFLSGDTLYGTTWSGGTGTNGTVFQVNTDGTGFTTLYNFSGADGANPYGGLLLLGSKLYGTTVTGGSAGKGVLFALNACALNLQPIGNSVVLRWSDPSFSLQAAPTLTGVYTNVPAAVSPFSYPVMEPQMFFRLRSN
jgi:uncharacterized repeat protein (TIGR03803 family)